MKEISSSEDYFNQLWTTRRVFRTREVVTIRDRIKKIWRHLTRDTTPTLISRTHIHAANRDGWANLLWYSHLRIQFKVASLPHARFEKQEHIHIKMQTTTYCISPVKDQKMIKNEWQWRREEKGRHVVEISLSHRLDVQWWCMSQSGRCASNEHRVRVWIHMAPSLSSWYFIISIIVLYYFRY